MNTAHSANGNGWHQSVTSELFDEVAGNTSYVPGQPSLPLPEAIAAHLPELSDNQLLIAARSGDQRAFVALCERHTAPLKRRIYKIVRNNEDAEDIVQDTLLRSYIYLDRFRGTCTFFTWLTSIGINQALMLLRKKKVRSEVDLFPVSSDSNEIMKWEYPDLQLDPEQLYAKRQIIRRVREAVSRPPIHYRQVVEPRYDEECTAMEIADTLGLTAAAVKTRLFRARNRLRSSLGKHKTSNTLSR